MKSVYRVIVYHSGDDVDIAFVVIPHEVYHQLQRVSKDLDLSVLQSYEAMGIVPRYMDFTLKEPCAVRVASINEGWCHPDKIPLDRGLPDELLEDDAWFDVEMTARQLDEFIERNKFSVIENPIFSILLTCEENGEGEHTVAAKTIAVWVRVAGEVILVPIDPS
jgi:hypothetical protein